MHTHNKFALYFNAYKDSLINLFMTSSIWLTLAIAIGRYMAVCRPLHARGLISVRGTYASLIGVYIGSTAINAVRFLHFYIQVIPCSDLLKDGPQDCNCFVYLREEGSLYQYKSFEYWYVLMWSVVVILIPLIVLMACNFCLIRSLRQSHQLQLKYRANNKPKENSHITPTLITLIMMFIVCVGPSELLVFFRQYVLSQQATQSRYYVYQIVLEVTNCLLLINFAMNFVLYCLVNTQFRRIMLDMVRCVWLRRRSRGHHRGRTVEMSSRRGNTGMYTLSEIETEM